MSDRTVHPIEAESYAILRSRVDLTAHPPLTRAVIERVIHASADLTYADDLVCDEPALHQGWTALHNGAPIVADVAMVASGITPRRMRPPPDDGRTDAPPHDRTARLQPDAKLRVSEPQAADPQASGSHGPDPHGAAPNVSALRASHPYRSETQGCDPHASEPHGSFPRRRSASDPAMVRSAGRGGIVCRIADPEAAELARERGITRSAAAVRLAAAEVGAGAVWVIGCAPTALYEVIAADVRPALVIGLPVGFVGAAESKAALRDSGLPAISNRGEKGGSAIAAAAVNALLYHQTTGRDL